MLLPAGVMGRTRLAAVAVTLREEEVARLEAPYRPHPVIGHA
jgi:1-deoxyxylulose-5-phosphate synthase